MSSGGNEPPVDELLAPLEEEDADEPQHDEPLEESLEDSVGVLEGGGDDFGL